jgi:hypothetical protein
MTLHQIIIPALSFRPVQKTSVIHAILGVVPMTEEEIKRELRNLKEQLALLQKEHAKTRNGWLYSLRNTGFLLTVFGVALLLGVWESQAKLNSNPVAITFAVMAIFMLALGLWLWFWSLQPLAERMMRVASRK